MRTLLCRFLGSFWTLLTHLSASSSKSIRYCTNENNNICTKTDRVNRVNLCKYFKKIQLCLSCVSAQIGKVDGNVLKTKRCSSTQKDLNFHSVIHHSTFDDDEQIISVNEQTWHGINFSADSLTTNKHKSRSRVFQPFFSGSDGQQQEQIGFGGYPNRKKILANLIYWWFWDAPSTHVCVGKYQKPGFFGFLRKPDNRADFFPNFYSIISKKLKLIHILAAFQCEFHPLSVL